MFELAIHLLEAFVATLILFLIYKLFSLSEIRQTNAITDQPTVQKPKSKQRYRKPAQDYSEKMEGLKLAQVFAGTQLIEIKRSIDNLQQDQLEWLREAISLYLIGAVDFIGRQNNCTSDGRKELIQLVLKSSLKLNQDYIAEYVAEAVNREPKSEHDHMVRTGAKAAKLWLRQNTVPNNFSLRTQLDDWGVFA